MTAGTDFLVGDKAGVTHVLELAFNRELPMADADGDIVLDGHDLTAVAGVAIYAGWVRGVGSDDGDFYMLTEAGQKQLAGLWGPDRVEPWSGGYYDCHEHGVYDAGPGDWAECPDCRKGKAA